MTVDPTLKAVLDVSPFASALLADDGKLIYLNSLMKKVLSLQSIEGSEDLWFAQFLHPDDLKAFECFLNNLSRPEGPQNWHLFHLITADGREEKIYLNGSAQLEGLGLAGAYLIAGMPELIQNFQVRDSNTAGETNQETNDTYRNLFDGAVIGVAILNEAGFLEDANLTFLNHFELKKEDVVNTHYECFLNKSAISKFENLLINIRKSKGEYLKDVITIDQDSHTPSFYEISVAKIINDGLPSGRFMVITEDISNQKDTHSALIQSEKLALTGRLAASLAHEINNPLQTSVGCLGLVEEMLGEDDQEIRVYITMALEELKRGARIVKKLRDLNRRDDTADKSFVDLQEIIEGVLLLTKNQFYDRNIVPVFPYQGPSPAVLASRDQIQQVVLNLVLNAIDAMPQGGRIYLDILPTENPDGINVQIRDTGTGIEATTMAHLFDPFFTTKADGLGLGLYNCKQIVEGHNGHLSVESECGKGTVFSVWLPGLYPSSEE